jgi:hypothetical protein
MRPEVNKSTQTWLENFSYKSPTIQEATFHGGNKNASDSATDRDAKLAAPCLSSSLTYISKPEAREISGSTTEGGVR